MSITSRCTCMLMIASFIVSLSGVAQAGDTKTPEPIAPTDGVIKLFNGKDLTGLYTWLKDTKYEDPRNVFTVKDGMLNISGDGLGAITTKNEYKNYHLIVDFKWGTRTWGERKNKALDSGVLVHCIGPDGNYSDTWMASIESQIIEGGTGDFIVIDSDYKKGEREKVSLVCEIDETRKNEARWKKGGPRKTFSGRIVKWYGRDPEWRDVLGFRGKNDLDSPVGEWTRLEVICDGGTITNVVNGVVVNQGFESFPSAGKILIQCELAEIFIRRWELWPIGKAPKYTAN